MSTEHIRACKTFQKPTGRAYPGEAFTSHRLSIKRLQFLVRSRYVLNDKTSVDLINLIYVVKVSGRQTISVLVY